MRGALRAAVAALVSAALVLTGALAAHAEEPSTTEQPLATVSGEASYRVNPQDALPAVESEIGRGAPLSTAPSTTVDLGPAAAGYDAALVRVSVLSPSSDTTVFSAGGSPILFAPAGVSTSTSVLLPVSSGQAELWADAPAPTRIDVIAAFSGEPTQPGSAIALPAPVTRADTAQKLGGSSLSAVPIDVGVVGKGGVPAERVRAVFATLDVDVPAATVVHVEAQDMPVPAGRSILTTILAPGSDGTVRVSADGAPGALRLDVRGWIPEAPFYADQLNVPGSFVVATDEVDRRTMQLDASQGPASAAVGDTPSTDAVFTFALVAATEASETTMLNYGDPYEGRARGLVVDAARGAPPQLVVAASRASSDDLLLRRGVARISWTPVGEIVGGERAAGPVHEAPAITLDSHRDGDVVDLGQHGYFTLSGTITTPGATVDRVEVSGPDGVIGTASIRFDDGRTSWSFDAAAPPDRVSSDEVHPFTYTATVYDRAGRSASAAVTLQVDPADPEDTVVAPDVWLYNSRADGPALSVVSDAEVVVSGDTPPSPGDTIVAGASALTPEGLLKTALAADRVDGAWHVLVGTADLNDVIFQSDVDQQIKLDDPQAISVDTSDARTDPRNTDTEYVDGPAPTAWIATGDQIDLGPLGCAPDPGFDPTVDDDQVIVESPPAGAGGSAGGSGSAPASCSGPEDVHGDEADVVSARAYDGLAAPALYGPLVQPALDPRDTDFNPDGLSASLGTQAALKIGWDSKTQSPKLTSLAEKAETWEKSKQLLDSQFAEQVTKNEAAIVVALKAQFGVKLAVVLKFHINWRWGVIPTGVVVDDFAVKIDLSIKSAMSIKAYWQTQRSITWWNKIASFRLPTISLPIGPIPLVVTNGVGIAMKGESTFAATLAADDIGSEFTVTYGTRYTDADGWRSLYRPPQLTSLDPLAKGLGQGIKASFKGSFTYGPEIAGESRIYGTAGPDITLAGQLGISGELKTDAALSKATLELQLFLRGEFSGKVKLDLLKWTVLDYKLFTIEGSWPILKKVITFWDDKASSAWTGPPSGPAPPRAGAGFALAA